MSQPRFHKPKPLPDLDYLGDAPDPATRAELAHTTAALLVGGHSGQRDQRDAATTQRFVHLAEDLGLETIAEIWSSAPAVSLPGALWRLYALRTWITGAPAQAAREFDAGLRATRDTNELAEVLAGVESPPGPDEVVRAADSILAGAFRGDFAIALERASAFVWLCHAGRSVENTTAPEAPSPKHAPHHAFAQLAADLASAAASYRAGKLD